MWDPKSDSDNGEISEILLDYYEDIAKKNKYVRNKFGMAAFLTDCQGFKVENMYSAPTGDGTVVTDYKSSTRRNKKQ